MNATRRLSVGMLAAALSLLGAPTGRAQTAPVVMNLGWSTPLDSDYGILGTKFEELVKQYTNGSVVVKLRCCAQIGTEDDAFKALQLGTIDGYMISQNNVSPHWPLMDVFVLPYVFRNAKHLLAVADGPVGEDIKKRIAADTKVHLLTFAGPSYRDFYNSVRPINAFKDMDGLKVRVPKNAVMIATFEAFGTKPVPLAWSDTPTALQTGTIDGSDNGTNVIQEMKFYEFSKNLAVLEAFAGFSPLFASDRFVRRLNPEQRTAVLKAAKEAGDFHAAYTAKSTDDVRAWLVKNGGMTLTTPDRAPFIVAAKAVQDKLAAERGPQFRELLEKIRAVPDTP